MNAKRHTFFSLSFLLIIVGSLLFSGEVYAGNSQYSSSQLKGFSMHPTIKSGETIFYRNTSVSDLKCGDIIVFKDAISGQRVCHRIVEIRDGKIKSKGDNNRFRDRGFVSERNLIGKVTHIDGHSVS